MTYDYDNGYCAVHTQDTVARLNDRNRGAGRVKIRYDVIKRDGNWTVIHYGLTGRELARVRAEIDKQGNILL